MSDDTETKGLREINMALKEKSKPTIPVRNRPDRSVPKANHPQSVRAQFFLSGKNQTFLFNAYLNDLPKKGDFFNKEENFYEVLTVTRQLESISDDKSLMKERALKVVVGKKESNVPSIIFKPLPKYGDHMTIEDFIDDVKCGAFTDDDGSGNWATDTQISNKDVDLSNVASGKKTPEWATHVVWFNK